MLSSTKNESVNKSMSHGSRVFSKNTKMLPHTSPWAQVFKGIALCTLEVAQRAITDVLKVSNQGMNWV